MKTTSEKFFETDEFTYRMINLSVRDIIKDVMSKALTNTLARNLTKNEEKRINEEVEDIIGDVINQTKLATNDLVSEFSKSHYCHIGYYGEEEDLKYMRDMTADELMECYEGGDGNFTSGLCDEDVIVLEEVKEQIENGVLKISSNGLYIFKCDGIFVDIYQKIGI